MTFQKGNEYRFKPKYTDDDLKLIREMLDAGRKDNEITFVMMGERPDVHPISIKRWIEKVKNEQKR